MKNLSKGLSAFLLFLGLAGAAGSCGAADRHGSASLVAASIFFAASVAAAGLIIWSEK